MTIPPKGTPKYEIINILRNLVRIMVTCTPFAVFMAMLTDSITSDLPIWLIISIGAILGGLLFIPAKEIGDSFWAMIIFSLEKTLGKPDINEDPNSQKSTEYNNWVQWMRNASPMQIAQKTFVGVARSIGIFMIFVFIVFLTYIAIIFFLSLATVREVTSFMVVFPFILSVLYLFFVLIVVALLALGSKLYFNEYYPYR